MSAQTFSIKQDVPVRSLVPSLERGLPTDLSTEPGDNKSVIQTADLPKIMLDVE
jgi:hypothetical protein